jgi:hypothetical protein
MSNVISIFRRPEKDKEADKRKKENDKIIRALRLRENKARLNWEVDR